MQNRECAIPLSLRIHGPRQNPNTRAGVRACVEAGVATSLLPGEPLWADLGAGRGAFTLAFADLLGPAGEIHAVDRDASALRENARAMLARFPEVSVTYHTADFTRPLELPFLDGIVMANSLHFQTDQEAVVRRLREYLAPGGRLLIVEYNIEHGNFAVPHPVPYLRWERLARGAGFEHTELLARRPSHLGVEEAQSFSQVPTYRELIVWLDSGGARVSHGLQRLVINPLGAIG